MRVKDIPGLDLLSTPEKILLVEDLWDSIAADESLVPFPESHLRVLEERMRRHEKVQGGLLSLEELQLRIERRK